MRIRRIRGTGSSGTRLELYVKNISLILEVAGVLRSSGSIVYIPYSSAISGNIMPTCGEI